LKKSDKFIGSISLEIKGFDSPASIQKITAPAAKLLGLFYAN
jgi:hypothetical protein